MFDEKTYLQDLAKETYEYAMSDTMDKRRKAWKDHNDLKDTKPLIYIRSIPFWEILDKKDLKCSDPKLRSYEYNFLLNRYRMTLLDDYIIEPYISIGASISVSQHSIWGIPCDMSDEVAHGNAKAFKPSIIELDDFKKMHVTDYSVDELQTAKDYEQLCEIFKDSIPIEINRQTPFSSIWNIDIATLLTRMRGLEQIMWDMYDDPSWLHEVLAFMRDSILRQINLTEKSNGFSSMNNQNQSMPYSSVTASPKCNTRVNSINDLWGFFAAQEFTGVGPDFFKEFMFDYQKPIIEKFGLVSYGCCEDMTQKIQVIKKLKNLRRIAVTPFSDAKKCAEQIGRDYIASWRPHPATAISNGINEDFIRMDLRKHFDIFRENNCIFDITLKDVETLSNDKEAINKWTSIVRDEIEKNY